MRQSSEISGRKTGTRQQPNRGGQNLANRRLSARKTAGSNHLYSYQASSPHATSLLQATASGMEMPMAVHARRPRPDLQLVRKILRAGQTAHQQSSAPPPRLLNSSAVRLTRTPGAVLRRSETQQVHASTLRLRRDRRRHRRRRRRRRQRPGESRWGKSCLGFFSVLYMHYK
jgi:hypothetical protein